jgi:hypothetical protein
MTYNGFKWVEWFNLPFMSATILILINQAAWWCHEIWACTSCFIEISCRTVITPRNWGTATQIPCGPSATWFCHCYHIMQTSFLHQIYAMIFSRVFFHHVTMKRDETIQWPDQGFLLIDPRKWSGDKSCNWLTDGWFCSWSCTIASLTSSVNPGWVVAEYST